MTAHKKARTNGREDSGFRNRLTEGQSRRYGIAIKAARPAMTIQSYTKIIAGRKPIVISYDALVSPKHCEHSVFGSLTFKKDQNYVLRLAKLIFKSGLNRTKLTALWSGAATPKKTFLMLARLSEIQTKSNKRGAGQQQLLIDNYYLE